MTGPGPMSPTPEYAALCAESEALGLACRGGFHPEPADAVPAFADGSAAATVILYGFIGSRQWPLFASSAERADGLPNSLDRWSRRVIDALALRHRAVGLYPSSGPPWLPFQRWARRAEHLHRSPLGILIHAEFGLWHAYRGALALRTPVALPRRSRRPSPCDSCNGRPCLEACPVGAVQPAEYDHVACHDHVSSGAGLDCFEAGCRARRSCPVGRALRYPAEQARFHMAAFVRRR